MPVGVLTNSLCVLTGGLIGALLKEKLPHYLKERMPLYFGVASIGMGVSMIMKMQTLSAVVLAVLLGAMIGELIHLEELFEKGARTLQRLVTKDKTEGGAGAKEANEILLVAMVLFCTSGTGIFGALTEGMTGDSSILISKSFLDLFTAVVFASTAGIAIALLCLPQFIVLMTLFFASALILPHTNAEMLADFSACGGFILIATGLRVAKIKPISIANLIPALVLAMPLHYIWMLFT